MILTTYERHPLSEVWGDLPDDVYADLVESIRSFKDIEVPVIWTLDGKVLDGWHRYRACIELNAPFNVKRYAGKDPAAFVIAKNSTRRHLTPGQRAACVVACREWAKAGRPKTHNSVAGLSAPSTTEQMAEEAKASTETVRQAKRAHEAGLGDAVRSGELSPKAAAEQARNGSDPGKPKPPTRTERLEAERDALSLEVGALKQEKADLQMRVDWFEAQTSDYEVDQYKRVNDQQAEIRTLQGRLNRLTNEKEEARRQARYWKTEAMKLGWKESRNGTQVGSTEESS